MDAGGAPHVLDFGLAGVLSGFLSGSLAQSRTIGFVGTPAYASPEHFAGAMDSVDVRSDVYAVGLMLYEVLTGRLPFDTAGRLTERARVLENQRPARPSLFRKGLGRDADSVVLKAIATEKSERYQSMDAFAEDLRRLSFGEAVLARSPSLGYQLSKLIRRHRVAFATALAFVGLVLAFGTVATILAMKERKAREAADWNAYVASIAAANASLRAEDAATAQEQLAEAPAFCRNWEWWYFQKMADESECTRQFPKTGAFQSDFSAVPAPLGLHAQVRVEGSHGPTWLTRIIHSTDRISPGGRYRAECQPCAVNLCDIDVVRQADGMRVAVIHFGSTTKGSLFSPNDRWLAITSWDGRVLVLDVARLDSGVPDAAARSFDFDSQWIAQCGDHLSSIAFDNSSTRLALACPDGDIQILDLESQQVTQRIPTAQRAAWALAFSPNGETIAMGSVDRTVSLWSIDERRCLWAGDGHRELISALDFTADGAQLASASWDRTIRIWDTSDGRLIRRLVGHTGPIESVVFSADGHRLYSMDRYAVVKIWSPESQLPSEAIGEFHRINGIAVTAGSTRAGWALATEGPNDAWREPRLSVISLRSRRKLANLDIPQMRGSTAAAHLMATVSSDGRWIAATQMDATVYLLDASHLEDWVAADRSAGPPALPVRELVVAKLTSTKAPEGLDGVTPEAAASITSIAADRDSQHLILSRAGGTVEFWNVPEGRCVWSRLVSQNVLCQIANIPNDRGIAVSTADGRLLILSIANGATLAETRIASERAPFDVQGGAVSPDGSQFIPLLSDFDPLIYKTRDLDGFVRFQGGAGHVRSVAFSPNGKRIVTGGEDGVIKLWNAADGRRVTTIQGHELSVSAMAFSTDGQTIITGGHDNRIRFWDIRHSAPNEESGAIH